MTKRTAEGKRSEGGAAHERSTPDPSPIEGLLARCEPQIRRLLQHYEVAPEDAEELLQRSLLVLVYRWDDLFDPAAWLLATLRNQCRHYHQGRSAD